MKKIFTLVILITLISTEFLSQNIGYLGKKVHMNIDFNIMPYYRVDNTNLASSGIKVLNCNPFINANFILGRRFEIGLSLGVDFVNYDTKKYDRDYNDFDNVSYSKNNLKGNYSFSEIHFRFFSKKYIAPFGIYGQVSFGVTKINIKDDEFTRTNYDRYNDSYNTETFLVNNKSILRAGFGMGKRIGFKKGYYFNGLFQYTYHFSGNTREYVLMKSEHFYNIRLGFGKVF